MVLDKALIFLSVPHLRERDVAQMEHLRELVAGGEIAELTPTFPCVTCPVQANMLTGTLPRKHGVIANGFFWREKRQVEMWTSPVDCFDQPLIWQRLRECSSPRRSAIWFAQHIKGADADLVCTPAPVHHPDGSETPWCYTRPAELYGQLRERLGDFPLHHYWGPLAGVPASQWIVDSAILAAGQFRPDFFYIYFPLLDYAAQRSGPDSPEAYSALAEADKLIGRLAEGMRSVYGDQIIWLIAGEYVITPVASACFPNRILREEGYLSVIKRDDGEYVDWERSRAFTLVDHQVAHLFVLDGQAETVSRLAEIFRHQPEIERVLTRADLPAWGLDHPRSGELILVAQPTCWFAYYWWEDDELAPSFARKVDIHNKPGYDPLELFWDRAAGGVPLQPELIRGSHGAPAEDPSQRTVVLISEPAHLPEKPLADVDMFEVIVRLCRLS
ncbi:MAG: alkaline phosphatase family protein [Thermoguttaceae bacterium]|nr:alkaline phosphatase family protein [Thermoguttaceae bacterium]MDW8077282.1 alkaline phosphatase family protein [Thermoguttaceae bacterium]